MTFLRGNRAGHTMTDLNYEVARVANRLLIELGLNHALWSRVYRGRVFVYNIQSRRAVLELGCITSPTGRTDQNGDSLYSGFELYVMGGIYNKFVTDDLMKLTVASKPFNRRVQHANSY